MKQKTWRITNCFHLNVGWTWCSPATPERYERYDFFGGNGMEVGESGWKWKNEDENICSAKFIFDTNFKVIIPLVQAPVALSETPEDIIGCTICHNATCSDNHNNQCYALVCIHLFWTKSLLIRALWMLKTYCGRKWSTQDYIARFGIHLHPGRRRWWSADKYCPGAGKEKSNIWPCDSGYWEHHRLPAAVGSAN